MAIFFVVVSVGYFFISSKKLIKLNVWDTRLHTAMYKLTSITKVYECTFSCQCSKAG